MPKPLSTAARIIFGFVLLAGLAGMTSAQSHAQVRLDVPYVPTPQNVVDHMLDMAKLTTDDVHVDLGSGDGRIVITAAKRGARSTGVDLNPTRVAEANENAKKAGVSDRVAFIQGDLFEIDISKADVLTMYLLQGVNLRLRPRILADLRPGSRVVSHAFTMNDWEADQHANLNGRNIYLWIVPGKAEGTWQAESGGRKFTLNLKQAFQKLTGTATIDGKSVPVTGRLTGNTIELSADFGGGATPLRGEIKDDAIAGETLRATRS
ncbi:MAG: methyltransferase domain-containing protein [Rhizobiales bacterium]|nr:methyltransferase domain-containing protein [Hyphomicrobiales bacterium]MPZ59583.1 methyltransferase domain-containing protein [Hyphomicrobiales bacterium]